MDKQVKELNLLLLYLSSWEEESRNNPGERLYRSWKGYKFDVLNELANDKFIRQSKESKSVIITDTGRAEAERLKKHYLEA